MLKRVTVLFIVLIMTFAIGCGKKEPAKAYKTVAVDSYLVENPGEKKLVYVPKGKLKRGEYVIVNEERDVSGKKFINVTIDGVTTRGWIDAVNLKEGKLESVAVIKDDDLYLRPNLKSEKTGTVKAGQVAFKIEENNEFVLIQFPGKEAYILKASLGDASMVIRTITIVGLGKATVAASSQYLPSEGKETSFDPRNVFDGKVQTAWCEGKSSDEGIGEFIILTFEKPVVLTQVGVVNGYASTGDSYKNNSRVASLKVISGNGQEVVIDLVDSNLDFQTSAMELYGTSFKFMINKVYSGKMSDTCISEIRLEGRTDFAPDSEYGGEEQE
ncbi:MAG TPA: hypothetical protein PK514_00875 [Spirochaetota bacterium]|nr:hypothetical protein [Spirochaetota bacterium]